MKINLTHIKVLAIIFLFGSTLIMGCGGGGGGGSSSGTTGTSGVTSGQITAFGSIFVNGVEFETESAEFEFEDESRSTQDDLRIGMVVRVEGSFDDNGATGRADRVRFNDNLEGPISSVSVSSSGLAKTITVMGQTVMVEQGSTTFDNSDPAFNFVSLDAGNVGNVVEVSGLPNADGSIQATFIERKALDTAAFLSAGGELEITGTMANLTANSLTINALTVSYDNTTLITDLENSPSGALQNGIPVEVKGSAFAGNTLTAISIEVKPAGLGVDDSAKAEVEGLISNLDTSGQTFTVNGQLVNYANADFDGGLAADLVNGLKVEAEGPISSGTLNALKVQFKGGVKIEANADSVDSAGGTLTLQALPGITITVDDTFTEFKDGISLNGIAQGNNLKIRARPSGSAVIATELELVDVQPDDRLSIQGAVDSFDASSGIVTILGIDVDTNQISNDNFEHENTVIGRSAFFAALQVGDLVKAQADIIGDSLSWREIEFEED